MPKVPTAIRVKIQKRDKKKCIRCGQPTTQIQHRIAGGMGGSRSSVVNRLSCLILLCGSGTTGCHGLVESRREWARGMGYALRRNSVADPLTTPVFYRGVWVLLDDDGGLTAVSDGSSLTLDEGAA